MPDGDPDQAAVPPSPDFLAGGGELGALMRAHDWGSTPLGPPETWPQSLKTAVRIMLTSRQPIWIGWGEKLTYLYNDPYKSIIGGKHPWALGRPTQEVWREIWDDIGPLLATAMKGVEGTYVEDQLLIMERHGYPEETYYTFSYSPVPNDDGSTGGIICANTDETQRVIGERQIALLRELAARAADTRTWQDACERSAGALCTNGRDLPFAAIYLADADEDALLLAGLCGVEEGHPAFPSRVDLDDGSVWPFADVLAKHEIRIVDGLSSAFDVGWPTGAWGEPPKQAAVLPVLPTGETGRSGALIVGLNPFRLFDDGYRGFLSLAAGQIGAAIANAEAYEQERRRAEALAEIDRAKTAFFSNVSHEFRTPLTLLISPVEEVLGRSAGNIPAEDRGLLEVAHRNSLRLLRLVNTLLDFSRIEAGRVQAFYEPLDLAALTADLASNFRSACDRAGLRLVVDCPPLSEPVWVDRDMWEKLVLNLISNAFKYTLQGEIEVRLRDTSGHVALIVRDTGIGIPAEELPRIFERFHRIEGQHGRTHEGSGIGLALVQELVKLHGGTVRVESEHGRGSVFSVSLPLGRDHLPADRLGVGAVAGTTASHAEAFVQEALRWLPEETDGSGGVAGLSVARDRAATVGGPIRVLVADDNADMRDYISRLLGRDEVEAVADGQAALEAIRTRRPDLLLTDVMMPRLDGFGLLRAIRGDPDLRDLPVIVLSARAGEEASVEGFAAGADGYLVKPFSSRELVARVDATLALARARREAAEALRESEARFRNMADNAPVMVWVSDPDGSCTFLSRSWYEFTGQTADAGLGFGWLDAVHPEDRGWSGDVYRAATTNQEAFRLEYRVRRVDGVYRWAIDAAVPRFGDDGKFLGFVGSVIDITERKATESALEERVATEVARREQTELALRQAQKMEAIGQLTGGVAHDFNNLLMVIQSSVERVQRLLPAPADENDRITRSLKMARLGIDRAAALTQRLLAFARRQPLDPKPLEANKLVGGMSELLRRTLGESISIETVLAGGLWWVHADPNQLENALLNLAVNSRDAMPEGGKLTIETANTYLDDAYARMHSEVAAGQYVMIAVTDTGSGMPRDVVEKAFEPFFTTKGIGQGTGLGLSQVYGFVKQSGGHVNIYSEPGEGTTIRLYLPRYMPTEADLEAGREQVSVAPPGKPGQTILVVEDEDHVRTNSVESLSELGYRVLEAADGDSALRMLERDPSIRLLFTDVGLPGGMNGRQLADEARRRRPELKVLFTTGYARNAIVHHGRLDPGVELLVKPYTYATLAAKVRQILEDGEEPPSGGAAP